MNIEIFDPRKIHPQLAANERGIELAFAQEYITHFNGNVVEVGAVTPYYLNDILHPVVDPFDAWPRCIKEDAEKYDFSGQNVLCISTVEHFGRGDYGNTDIDPQKAERFLQKLIKETNSFLITWPVASNKELDQYTNSNLKEFASIYHRIWYNPPIWEYIGDWLESDFNSIRYNDPFPNGNAIYLLQKEFSVL